MQSSPYPTVFKQQEEIEEESEVPSEQSEPQNEETDICEYDTDEGDEIPQSKTMMTKTVIWD